MSKRLAVSRPTVIQTELRPLNESFWIEPSSQLEQWYYQNTDVFMPDRQIAVLILTPKLSALDPDANNGQGQTYTPDFIISYWKVKQWNGTAWVEQQISTQDASADFYVSSETKALYVRKNNYDAAHAINITCRAYYQDPRDTNITCYVESSTMLTTSVDATQVFPSIEIKNPSARAFNPLKDNPIYEFEADADWSPLNTQGGASITEYKVDPLGTEEILPTNDDMVINAAPILDVKYGDVKKENQQFMHRQVSGGLVNPIVGDMANITNIKGNTVVWNQLLQNGDFSNGINDWYALHGNLSFENGVAKVTQTSDNYVHLYRANNSRISGHKYIYTALVRANSGNFYFSDTPDNVGSLAATGNWQIFQAITTATSTSTTSYPRIALGGISSETLYVGGFNIFDLTLMFGEGHEPSTVAEFETWLATNVGLKDYYEYCPSKLISFGGYGVKMNQLVKNGDFKDTSEWTAIGGTLTINSKIASFTATRTGDNFVQQIFTYVTGHKYYFHCLTYADASSKAVVRLYYGESDDYQTLSSNNANVWESKGAIFTCQTQTYNLVRLVNFANGSTNKYSYIKTIDLTLMFGEGNEPTKEWCDAHFTQDYYPYCPSYDTNVMNISGIKLGMKSVGFNLLDEEWEVGFINQDGEEEASGISIRSKNFIQCFPDTDYYLKKPNSAIYTIIKWYDGSKNYIGGSTTDVGIKRSPSNAIFFKVSGYQYGATYNHDICINLSDTSRNGTYEPHWESEADMSWISKIGIENFNIWDEEWTTGNGSNGDIDYTQPYHLVSKNFIPVVSGNTYYIKSDIASIGIYGYDENKTKVDTVSLTTLQNSTYTIPNGVSYIKFQRTGADLTYNHDICINESIPHFNGRYVPYGETALYFPNGICGVGSVSDEVKVVDGKIKGVVRVGSVDLGTLAWYYNSNSLFFFMLNGYIFPTGQFKKRGNYLQVKYTPNNVLVPQLGDKEISNTNYISDTASLIIKDSSYTDATAFKTAMSGVMLYYELAEPYEFEIDYPTKGQFEWYGISNGSEVKIDTLPCYQNATQPVGYGQGTPKININALYGEDISVILRMKRHSWDAYPMPMKVTKSVAWKIPPINVDVVSDKGSAVRAQNQSANFTFSTIVNQQGEAIPDDVKAANMVFNWYYQKFSAVDGTALSPVSLGTGLTKSVAASTLKNTKPNNGNETPSTNVYCEAYILGAYHLVNGEYVRD